MDQICAVLLCVFGALEPPLQLHCGPCRATGRGVSKRPLAPLLPSRRHFDDFISSSSVRSVCSVMARHGYHAVSLSGPPVDRCSSCELLNILHKSRSGQKQRCKDCIEKENKRKMKNKHIPVHLRKRNLHEQTEKASRILAEEMESHDGIGAAERAQDGNGFVSAARAPLLISSAGRNPEEEEQVKLSDILELTMELLDLVEQHVGRSGTLEDVARFEAQMKVLRHGRDRARTSFGHVEDKRAIVLAFSIFTEHYTVTIREFDKLIAKNAALKQLAYDTAGLVKKSEAQFESYVQELKSLQGANFEVAHSAKVELTQLRNEVTALKLELNLRTNELRELQLDANSTQEQLDKERQRSEEMRKDKDSRITSLLAQLQQFSLDYAHEKGERLRLERENERLWNDRMAYRAEQIRNSQLNGAERALALERDALEKREWLEWKKKAALREIQAKERLRQDAWELRQGIEADAHRQMELLRAELSGAAAAESRERNAAQIKLQQEQELQRVREREARDRAERERQYWSEIDRETATSSSTSVNTQRWEQRKNQLRDEAEIDRMIAALQAGSAQLTQRALTQLQSGDRPLPAADVVRAGNYAGGVESVINVPRASPALPLFTSQQSAQSGTSSGYQPSSIASAIPPASTAQLQQQQQQQPQGQVQPASAGGITEADRAAIRKEMEQLLQEQLRQRPSQEQPALAVNPKRSARTSDSSRSQRPRSSTSGSSRTAASDTAASSGVDLDDVEDSLRRSRKVRGESSRVAASTSYKSSTSSTHRRAPADVSSSEDEKSRDREERKYTTSTLHHTKDDHRSSSDSDNGSSRKRTSARAPAELQRTSRAARSDNSEDEQPHRRQQNARSERRSRSRSRSRSSSRSREEPAAASFTVGGREAVPVRNFTLYSVKKSTEEA